MLEKRIRIEQAISRLPVHDQLKILKYILSQLDVFQQEFNPICEEKGHEFGKWYSHINSSKKLAEDGQSFWVLKSTSEEWSRLCMRCGYVERVHHQSSEPSIIKKPAVDQLEEQKKTYLKKKNTCPDI